MFEPYNEHYRRIDHINEGRVVASDFIPPPPQQNVHYGPAWPQPQMQFELVDIIAPEKVFTLSQLDRYQQILNEREEKIGSARRYRVFPYGTIFPGKGAVDDNFKAVIKCQYCHQWGARGCACKSCGAPIG